MREMLAFHKTKHGQIVLGDSLDYMAGLKAESVDLIVTSPPFGREFKRILKPSGSIVIDIGGAWIPRQPTRSLYHFELVRMLTNEGDTVIDPFGGSCVTGEVSV